MTNVDIVMRWRSEEAVIPSDFVPLIADSLRVLGRVRMEEMQVAVMLVYEGAAVQFALLQDPSWDTPTLATWIADESLAEHLVQDPGGVREMLSQVYHFSYLADHQVWRWNATEPLADPEGVASVLADLVGEVYHSYTLEILFLLPTPHGQQRYEAPSSHDLKMGEIRAEAEYWRNQE
jgi:hypothetical protein